MPGKVNPVIPEVGAPGRRAGDRQRHRDHGRRHAGPVRAQRADPADRAQPAPVDRAALSASPLLAEKCVDGIEPNDEGLRRSAEGTLAVATALNPFIGYDKAAEIVKAASESGGTLREVAREHGVDEETLDKALDLRKIAAGSKAERERPRAARRVAAFAARASSAYRLVQVGGAAGLVAVVGAVLAILGVIGWSLAVFAAIVAVVAAVLFRRAISR